MHACKVYTLGIYLFTDLHLTGVHPTGVYLLQACIFYESAPKHVGAEVDCPRLRHLVLNSRSYQPPPLVGSEALCESSKAWSKENLRMKVGG